MTDDSVTYAYGGERVHFEKRCDTCKHWGVGKHIPHRSYATCDKLVHMNNGWLLVKRGEVFGPASIVRTAGSFVCWYWELEREE